MRSPSLVIVSLIPLALVASCSAPPKPPMVDESTKRPANAAIAVELQICKSDLENNRLLALEDGRLAQRMAILADISAWQQAVATLLTPTQQVQSGNVIYMVRFEFASSRFSLPSHVARALIEDARPAPLILLRGRTDGVSDTAAEARIAHNRAVAVRNYLMAAGIEASRIRLTYQPTGDHVADNASHAGRALNRRVEIEIYRVAPVPTAWDLRAG